MATKLIVSVSVIVGLSLFILPENSSARPGRNFQGFLAPNSDTSGWFSGPFARSFRPFSDSSGPFSGHSSPFFGSPQWPPYFLPRPPFFVGSFQSDPETQPQVNMWQVFDALGLPTGFVNEILRINITQEGNESNPPTYRLLQTAVEANQTVREIVFQLGVPDSAVFNDDIVQYFVQAVGDRLFCYFNSNSTGISSLVFDFEFRGVREISTIGNVTGTRGYNRI